MAKYFFIAGEASGDKHAAELIQQMRQREPEALFAGLGGDLMETAGCVIYRHIRYMAFMGVVAVLRHWRDVKENFRIAREALLKEQPDVLVLIDYPSFNLKMASFCKKQLPKTKIVYYIPPKVWAWKKRRVHRISRLCDQVLGIFPFEPAFYARYGYSCEYVGHPTVEQVEKVRGERLKVKGERAKDSIALLPGSRPGEISHCLPQMLKAARHFPTYNIIVCAAPGIEDDFYAPYLREDERLTRDTYATVQQAAAAIVNSGTATLETALLGCPQVAVYHVAFSRVFEIVFRCLKPVLFSIPYFTPVNIIVGKEVIKECVAYDFTVDKVTAELGRLLRDEAYKKELLASYEQLSSILGSRSASGTAADIITSKP
ncbi:MAG: lipid-A-disaccharide synthase [Paludibacteraceae bacterium]|nr:lipid-A-disaccharide synthase [Paludibacteraceae bacterium]